MQPDVTPSPTAPCHGGAPPVSAGARSDADALVTAAPALLLAWDAAGRCTHARVGRPDGRGVGVGELAGDGWLDLLHAESAGRAAELVRAVLSSGEADEAGVLLRSGRRWALLRAQPAPDRGVVGALVEGTRSLGDTARIARVVEGFNRLRRPEDIVRAVLDELALLGGHTASIHVLSEGGGELVVAGASGTAEDLVRTQFRTIALDAPLPAAEVLRTGEMVVVRSHADRRARYPQLDELPFDYEPAFVVVPLLGGDGRPFGALGVGFDDERWLDDREHEVLLDVASQCALALDRARLTAIAERNQERLRFLDALSESLSSDLELDSTLTRLAEMVVPRLADWCVVRVAGPAGAPGPILGVAHVDPDRRDDLLALAQRIPRDPDRSGPVGAALAAGRPLVGRRAEHRLFGPVFDERDDATIAGVGADTVAVFPLTARGRLLGALAFGDRPGRTMGPADVQLAELVATRAATLVDNARLFHEQSGVARALQESLLPGVLPVIPGLELGARYRAAGPGLEVGGDFYDAFPVDENWWMVAVGDVCGHGVEAAALTGLVRHTIRASAMAGTMPSAILARLNDMLLRHSAELAARARAGPAPSPRFCTVVVGAIQPSPRGVDLILCLAGHPLPLVRRASGEVLPVGVPGTLLGVTENLTLIDSVVRLDPGEVLVCYTDGLVDRRSGLREFGQQGLIDAIADAGTRSAPDLAGYIEARALGFVDEEPTDDMAVLTLLARP